MPLMGSQGPGSNISWRGNLDEYPNSFTFEQQSNVDIGIAVTSSTQTITGINYKALVTAVGSGVSVSINGGQYIPGNDENNPIIIRNNDTVSLQLRTQDTSNRLDYSKVYASNIKIGKRETSWVVVTKDIDDDPVPFSFSNTLNNEVSIARTSNEVQVEGIDGIVGVDVLITSPTGKLFINGVDSGRSAKILNNSRLYLQNTTSGFYNQSVLTNLSLGSYSTSWSISTRQANTTVNSFDLGSITDAEPNSIQVSNTITVTGPDPNVNGNNVLTASIVGSLGEFRVVRNGVEVRAYSSQPASVQTGDQITVRSVASSEYQKTEVTTLTINQTSGSFSTTTRPDIIRTFPTQFNFVDVTNASRTSPSNVIDSQPVTLTGMSTLPTDFGTASITGTGGDGLNAQFRVVRNNVTVRDFSSDNFQVRNGDVITLRIISSPNSLGIVQASFTVSGVDTTNSLIGIPGSTTDTWTVTSAQRFCNISTLSFDEELNAEPDQTYTRTFVASGFDADCGCTISTSDVANSYLQIGDITGTTLNVNVGDTVTLYMVCPYYDTTRSTTVTIQSSYGTSRSAIFKITPKAPPLPELTLDANPRNSEFVFPTGGSTVLSYTYNYVTNATVTTNFGVTTIPITSGTGTNSVTGILTTTTYTMTVSNSTGSTTRSVQVTVGTPPTPTITLCPSPTGSCFPTSKVTYGNSITLYWYSQFATSITSPDFNTGNQQNGSVTLTNLSQDNKTYTINVSGPGGTATASHTIDLTPVIDLFASQSTITRGQSTTLLWTSTLADYVVSTLGFSASSVSGSTIVSPSASTTYSITVADFAGNLSSDSVTITVEDDRTVDPFYFNPTSFTSRNYNEIVVSEPVFQGPTPSAVSGLSPNVTVTATVTGTGAQFESGGLTKTVQNGTPTSSLRVSLLNANTPDTQRTASLSINGVLSSFSSTTRVCTSNNTTSTIDNAITILLREAQGYTSFIAYGIQGGTSTIPRTSPSSGGTQDYTSPGSYTFTVPAGVTRLYLAGIGGGGAGFQGKDCSGTRYLGVAGSGAGAAWGYLNVSAGNQLSITVGRRGTLSTINGENTSIIYNSIVVLTASGGGGGIWSGNNRIIYPGGTGSTSLLQQFGTSSGGTGTTSGGGGGAGKIGGGTANSGQTYQGGRGSNLDGTTNPGSTATGSGCAINGGDGGSYGAGGGAGAGSSGSGGRGGNGAVRIEWQAEPLPTYTYAQLITEIFRGYRDKQNRGPFMSEISTWVTNFKINPTFYKTPSDIYNAIPSSPGPFPVDNCGLTIPVYPPLFS